MVAIAFFSFRRIRSLRVGVLFGFGVALVSAMFFVALPFFYFGLVNYPDYVGLEFVILTFRFVGFSIAGLFGSYIWFTRQPYDA